LSDIGHAALDVAGLVPGVGEVADLANAAWYAAEGDYANAALSAASAIPFAGYAASAAKGAKYAAKGVDAAQSASKGADAARTGSKAANAAQGGGKAAPSPAKASSGGGGPTGGAKAASGGGSAGPAKAGGRSAGASRGSTSGGSAASRGGNCRTNSFIPGTAVLMADGSYKAIEDVELGDDVLATDPELGVTEARPVVALITGDGDKRLVEVTVHADGADTAAVVATDGHPFWVQDRGSFVAAKDLQPGDRVEDADGDEVTVVAVRAWTQTRQVHNLTVDGIHTYYVRAGSTDLLVHNCTFENNQPQNWAAEKQAMDASGFTPTTAGSSGFRELVLSKEPFLWAVRGDGTLAVGPVRFNGMEVKHSMLAGGNPVRGAGMGQSPYGGSIKLNNHSGHYWKDNDDWRRVKDDVGTPAFENAGVSVMARDLGMTNR
jgi:hypothetical protein